MIKKKKNLTFYYFISHSLLKIRVSLDLKKKKLRETSNHYFLFI